METRWRDRGGLPSFVKLLLFPFIVWLGERRWVERVSGYSDFSFSARASSCVSCSILGGLSR
jgi:hypothetical protein